MVAFILPANSASSGDFITNSLRLNSGDNPKLARTPSTAGNRRTFSISFWQKKADVPNDNDSIIGVQGSDDATNFEVVNHNTQSFQIGLYHVNVIRTNRLFRDPSAWNHYFFFFDTTQASESNRFQLYIDGVQETSFSQTNIPSQNADLGMGRDTLTNFFNNHGTSKATDAYIADFHYIDGIKKAPTDFGETNSNGVWVPIEYEGNYGDQGIHLEFKETGTDADASGIGADTSGNGNHLTPTNLAATDITTDTPMNNFATFNPLIAALAASGNATAVTLSEGNCKSVTANAGKLGGTSTIMISRGKWYAEFEFEATNNSGSTVSSLIGVTDSPQLNANSFGKVGERANDVGYEQTGNKSIGDNRTSYGNTYTTGDIIGVAVDLDNNAIYFSKNGTFQNSGDPTSGASKTGAIALTDPSSTVEGGYFFGVSEGTTETSTHLANFGAAYPAAISSGNADANGHGNFEFAVPSGYFALCTKNLAEYG